MFFDTLHPFGSKEDTTPVIRVWEPAWLARRAQAKCLTYVESFEARLFKFAPGGFDPPNDLGPAAAVQ
jgi:hypothetical protein